MTDWWGPMWGPMTDWWGSMTDWKLIDKYPWIDAGEGWVIIKHDNGSFYMAHKDCEPTNVSIIYFYTECVKCGIDAPEGVQKKYNLLRM